MSILGGTGGGNRVPKAPPAANSPLQNGKNHNSLIKTATWGRTAISPRDNVAMNIVFNRLPMSRMVKIEVLFIPANGTSKPVGVPRAIDATALQLTSNWRADVTRIPDYSDGHFTFCVHVDNETVTSNKLEIVDNNVSRFVKRISIDGFDR